MHPSSGTLLGRRLLRAPIDARSCLLASLSPSAAGSVAIHLRRKTPSATIKATPPTSTDSTRSREPVATASEGGTTVAQLEPHGGLARRRSRARRSLCRAPC